MLAGILAFAAIFGFSSFAEAFNRLDDWLEGSEETIVIFPTYAAAQEDGGVSIPVHAWVYEPEADSTTRSILIKSLKSALEIEDPTERKRFERRIRPFLFDNERGKTIDMKLADESFRIGTTTPDGHVTKRIEVPKEVVEQAVHETDGGRWLEPTFEAEFGTTQAAIPIIERTGLTVVSDIDDTIKETDVLNRKEMLRNTFFREFRAIEGMAPSYGELREEVAPTFHYLSASPWQLLPFLQEFMRREKYPKGLYHLRSLRPKSISSPIDFVNGSSDFKKETLRQLLSDFPNHEFVLIGDSSEHDPEVYGSVAADHLDQIQRIWIREVEGADNQDKRFDEALSEVPDARWNVFQDPSEITVESPSASDLEPGASSDSGDAG